MTYFHHSLLQLIPPPKSVRERDGRVTYQDTRRKQGHLPAQEPEQPLRNPLGPISVCQRVVGLVTGSEVWLQQVSVQNPLLTHSLIGIFLIKLASLQNLLRISAFGFLFPSFTHPMNSYGGRGRNESLLCDLHGSCLQHYSDISTEFVRLPQ